MLTLRSTFNLDLRVSRPSMHTLVLFVYCTVNYIILHWSGIYQLKFADYVCICRSAFFYRLMSKMGVVTWYHREVWYTWLESWHRLTDFNNFTLWSLRCNTYLRLYVYLTTPPFPVPSLLFPPSVLFLCLVLYCLPFFRCNGSQVRVVPRTFLYFTWQ